MPRADVIVVGAGIVGAAVAHQLAGEGLDVLVLDARLPSATAAGMGHLVVMDEPEAEFALSRLSLTLWQEWRAMLDARAAWSDCGTLWLAADEAETTLAIAKRGRLAAAGVACEWLDAHALAEAEPSLRAGLAGGLRVAGDAIVYAPVAAEQLLQRAARPVKLERAEVVALGPGGQRVRLRDGSSRDAAAVVLATGVHGPRLLPGLPVVPKKGHLMVTDRYPGRVRHQLLELGYAASAHAPDGTSVAFNVQPRPTGQLLVGSSRQFDRRDTQVEPDLLGRMLRRAVQYLPPLAQMRAVRSWAGLRPTTPDGQPLIGAHPERRGLWLALGHEGLGTTTAPGTARLLAALMLGREPPLAPAAFAPTRFGDLA